MTSKHGEIVGDLLGELGGWIAVCRSQAAQIAALTEQAKHYPTVAGENIRLREEVAALTAERDEARDMFESNAATAHHAMGARLDLEEALEAAEARLADALAALEPFAKMADHFVVPRANSVLYLESESGRLRVRASFFRRARATLSRLKPAEQKGGSHTVVIDEFRPTAELLDVSFEAAETPNKGENDDAL